MKFLRKFNEEVDLSTQSLLIRSKLPKLVNYAKSIDLSLEDLVSLITDEYQRPLEKS